MLFIVMFVFISIYLLFLF